MNMNLSLEHHNWTLSFSWLERCTGIAGPQVRFPRSISDEARTANVLNGLKNDPSKGLIPRPAKCEKCRAKTHLCENFLPCSDFHSREKIHQNTSIWLVSLFFHPNHKHLIGFAISISQRSRNEFNSPAKRNISQRNIPKSCCASFNLFARNFSHFARRGIRLLRVHWRSNFKNKRCLCRENQS